MDEKIESNSCASSDIFKVNLDIHCSLSKLFCLLIFIEIFLLTASTFVSCCQFVNERSLIKLFDITLEANLPTWFSAIQFILVGGAAYFIYCGKKISEQKNAATAWLIISLFFIYMGIDDASQLHERMATSISHFLKTTTASIPLTDSILSFRSYYWQILFLPLFAMMGLFMVIFLYFEFENKKTFMLFCAGISCYCMAVLLDYSDGISATYRIIEAMTGLSGDMSQRMSRSLEEFIEMFGTSCILISILSHWGRNARELSTSLRS